jgi:hypothetical protein
MEPDDLVAGLWNGPIHWFCDWPTGNLPRAGSLVYTIWNREGAFVYVGLAGRSAVVSATSKGPAGRLQQHARGGRSGDQFLIYICDRLVLPRLGNRLGEIAEGTLSLDQETRAYVNEHLGFRWLAVENPEMAHKLERALQAGQYDPPGKPFLNPRKG